MLGVWEAESGCGRGGRQDCPHTPASAWALPKAPTESTQLQMDFLTWLFAERYLGIESSSLKGRPTPPVGDRAPLSHHGAMKRWALGPRPPSLLCLCPACPAAPCHGHKPSNTCVHTLAHTHTHTHTRLLLRPRAGSDPWTEALQRGEVVLPGQGQARDASLSWRRDIAWKACPQGVPGHWPAQTCQGRLEGAVRDGSPLAQAPQPGRRSAGNEVLGLGLSPYKYLSR